jgi:hypothetical protein
VRKIPYLIAGPPAGAPLAYPRHPNNQSKCGDASTMKPLLPEYRWIARDELIAVGGV